MDRPRKQKIDYLFIHALVSSLPNLRWFGLSLCGKKDEQIIAIANSILDLKNDELDIRLEGILFTKEHFH